MEGLKEKHDMTRVIFFTEYLESSLKHAILDKICKPVFGAPNYEDRIKAFAHLQEIMTFV